MPARQSASFWSPIAWRSALPLLCATTRSHGGLQDQRWAVRMSCNCQSVEGSEHNKSSQSPSRRRLKPHAGHRFALQLLRKSQRLFCASPRRRRLSTDLLFNPSSAPGLLGRSDSDSPRQTDPQPTLESHQSRYVRPHLAEPCNVIGPLTILLASRRGCAAANRRRAGLGQSLPGQRFEL